MTVLPDGGINLDRSSLSSLMKTCRTLHHAGVPHILAGKVSLGSKMETVESFCDFILRDKSRAAHVRWLEIPVLSVDVVFIWNVVVGKVIPALGAMRTSLRRLEIHNVETDWTYLTTNPRLLKSTVASFANLTTIDFREIGPEGENLVRGLGRGRDTITDISISWERTKTHNRPSNIVHLLSSHYIHLTTLTLHATPPLLELDDSVQFPHVHTLQLEINAPYMPFNRFCHLFPQVCDLDWYDQSSGEEWEEEEADQLRQVELQTGSQRSVSHLVNLTCAVIRAYTTFVGVTGVQYWHPCYIMDVVDEALRVSQFNIVLQDIRPVQLEVGFAVDTLADLFKLSPEGIQQLRLTQMKMRLVWYAETGPDERIILGVRIVPLCELYSDTYQKY